MRNDEKTVVAVKKFRSVAKNKRNALSVTVYSTVVWFEVEWFNTYRVIQSKLIFLKWLLYFYGSTYVKKIKLNSSMG